MHVVVVEVIAVAAVVAADRTAAVGADRTPAAVADRTAVVVAAVRMAVVNMAAAVDTANQ
jgi:hypothetical protein